MGWLSASTDTRAGKTGVIILDLNGLSNRRALDTLLSRATRELL